MMNIRKITIDDAAPYLKLCRQLDEETSFMLFEHGERTLTVAEQRDQIDSILKTHNQMVFVAESGGRLVGHLMAMGGRRQRNHKTVHIAIGILQDYVGQGIGTQLFEAMEKWARQNGLHRLELTVMTHNARAVALYRKMGFEIEGTARDTLLVDCHYVDEHSMAKLLS